jgi:hypothetical protein
MTVRNTRHVFMRASIYPNLFVGTGWRTFTIPGHSVKKSAIVGETRAFRKLTRPAQQRRSFYDNATLGQSILPG